MTARGTAETSDSGLTDTQKEMLARAFAKGPIHDEGYNQAAAMDAVVKRMTPGNWRASQSMASNVIAAGLSGDHGSIVVRRLSEIQTKPIRWLWPGRIARGKVSMIAGHPGLGKSQVTAALAAVVTTGGKWPVDISACEVGSVILLNAEDDAADTIRPRLEAAGADVSRIEIVEAVTEGFRA